jgi:hypothetical protein
MSNKMLKELRYRKNPTWMKRHSMALLENISHRQASPSNQIKLAEKAATKRSLEREQFSQEEKRRYRKMLISNYPLLIVLFLLISAVCIDTRSPFFFIFAAIWFSCLLKMHHRSRIIENGHDYIGVRVYQDAYAVMLICTIMGLMTTVGLIVVIYLIA